MLPLAEPAAHMVFRIIHLMVSTVVFEYCLFEDVPLCNYFFLFLPPIVALKSTPADRNGGQDQCRAQVRDWQDLQEGEFLLQVSLLMQYPRVVQEHTEAGGSSIVTSLSHSRLQHWSSPVPGRWDYEKWINLV